ncbi:uncharacterized protein BX664DRAFT_331469 [Halteromyces radiatus]|uniref:uncharacterized protein n=1 Tax=Halteromyces radiatus TaxID=101107 RepID=UPI0022212056|nr:uncharacterized protein BX664DRAFT_331469 [Halteromyces radiatus]KAI8088821.1 hypothetical protein BX664DRAFT_331469 [Halteromyces radiatus]
MYPVFQFAIVTYILSAVVYGILLLASACTCLVRRSRSFSCMALLIIACIGGIIGRSVSVTAPMDDRDTLYVYPSFILVVYFFDYIHLWALYLLPVIIIHQLRKSSSDVRFSKVILYLGYGCILLGFILLITAEAIAGRINATMGVGYNTTETMVLDDDFRKDLLTMTKTYANVSEASYLILWFHAFSFFFICLSGRSLGLNAFGSFVTYNLLMILPLIIQTVELALYTNNPTPVFHEGIVYANFFLYDVAIFFAVVVALFRSHLWVHPKEIHQRQSSV